MKLSNENGNTKPNISIEGKMNAKDTGRVAIIMAYGKTISLIIGSLASAISAIILLIWRLYG